MSVFHFARFKELFLYLYLEGVCQAGAGKVRQKVTEEKTWHEEVNLINFLVPELFS
jgi:hypothetical protein